MVYFCLLCATIIHFFQIASFHSSICFQSANRHAPTRWLSSVLHYFFFFALPYSVIYKCYPPFPDLSFWFRTCKNNKSATIYSVRNHVSYQSVSGFMKVNRQRSKLSAVCPVYRLSLTCGGVCWSQKHRFYTYPIWVTIHYIIKSQLISFIITCVWASSGGLFMYTCCFGIVSLAGITRMLEL
jgi:hypothetical protein